MSSRRRCDRLTDAVAPRRSSAPRRVGVRVARCDVVAPHHDRVLDVLVVPLAHAGRREAEARYSSCAPRCSSRTSSVQAVQSRCDGLPGELGSSRVPIRWRRAAGCDGDVRDVRVVRREHHARRSRRVARDGRRCSSGCRGATCSISLWNTAGDHGRGYDTCSITIDRGDVATAHRLDDEVGEPSPTASDAEQHARSLTRRAPLAVTQLICASGRRRYSGSISHGLHPLLAQRPGVGELHERRGRREGLSRRSRTWKPSPISSRYRSAPSPTSSTSWPRAITSPMRSSTCRSRLARPAARRRAPGGRTRRTPRPCGRRSRHDDAVACGGSGNASRSSDDMPIIGTRSACASALPVARPTRIPVNSPGPTSTAMHADLVELDVGLAADELDRRRERLRVAAAAARPRTGRARPRARRSRR